jgi:hypothetical protein
MLAKGKSVKKYAEGELVQSDPNDIGGDMLRKIGKVPMVGKPLQRGATVLRDNVMGNPEQNRIARAQMQEIARKKAMAAAAGGEGGDMGGMDMGGGAPPPPAAGGGGGDEPLSESTLFTKSKQSKILGMLGEETEDFNILFDMEKAQKNIYEIETKITDILND